MQAPNTRKPQNCTPPDTVSEYVIGLQEMVRPPPILQTGQGSWVQAPHNPLPGLRYKHIETSQGPPRKEALNWSAWETSPWTMCRCLGVHLPPTPTTRTHSRGGQKLIHGNPSLDTTTQPPFPPSLIESSANRARRLPLGESYGPLVERRKWSAALQRTLGEYPTPGRGPQ